MENFESPAFLHHSNIYCVNLRQYSPEGTFKAFGTHLNRLKEMGVEILWFMPIHPIGKIRRKGTLGSYYSIADFKGVNPEFGTEEAFKQLIDLAHSHGMRVIMDWVANHAAWDNVWTISNPEFFVKDEQGNFKPPYDWDDVIQVDHMNPLQQEAMTDAMLYWIREFDIDGFRADLAHLTPLPFWINARQQASLVKDNLIWLAETEEINYHQAFDISFTWRWMHETEKYCKGELAFSALPGTLDFYRNEFPSGAVRMWFTSNHDENSWNGTAFEKYGDFVKALSVFNATYYGIPLIYSGEENGLNKRLKFFDKDPIEWNNDQAWSGFYRTLLHFRKTSHIIAAGEKSYPVLLKAGTDMLSFYREYNQQQLFVGLNMGRQTQTLRIPPGLRNGSYKNIFTGETILLEGNDSLQLESAGFVVLEGRI